MDTKIVINKLCFIIAFLLSVVIISFFFGGSYFDIVYNYEAVSARKFNDGAVKKC